MALELDLELEDVIASSMIVANREANLAQTLDPVALVFAAELGRVVRGANHLATAEAKVVSSITLGLRPDNPPLPPGLFNLTGKVRVFGGAILCFVGPPHKTIDWRLLEGNGTLTPYTTFTDELGRCSCRYDAAGVPEVVVIGAAYVP